MSELVAMDCHCLTLHLMELHQSVQLTITYHFKVCSLYSASIICNNIPNLEPEFIDVYEFGDYYYFFMRETAEEIGHVSMRPVSCYLKPSTLGFCRAIVMASYKRQQILS